MSPEEKALCERLDKAAPSVLDDRSAAAALIRKQAEEIDAMADALKTAARKIQPWHKWHAYHATALAIAKAKP